jgi:hypothetical protein
MHGSTTVEIMKNKKFLFTLAASLQKHFSVIRM